MRGREEAEEDEWVRFRFKFIYINFSFYKSSNREWSICQTSDTGSELLVDKLNIQIQVKSATAQWKSLFIQQSHNNNRKLYCYWHFCPKYFSPKDNKVWLLITSFEVITFPSLVFSLFSFSRKSTKCLNLFELHYNLRRLR